MARRLVVDPQCPAPAVLAEALAVLRGGGVVAYPTDTVYGLAVDAMRPDAIARLYTVKGRPESKALPVIIGALTQLAAVVTAVPARAERLIAAFWPGPLTLLLPPHPRVPAALLGDSDRIGVPIDSSSLQGLDALLAIVQMPQGVPVATVAIGKTGAVNAGILAAQILALQDPDLAARLHHYKAELAAGVERTDATLQAQLQGQGDGSPARR